MDSARVSFARNFNGGVEMYVCILYWIFAAELLDAPSALPSIVMRDTTQTTYSWTVHVVPVQTYGVRQSVSDEADVTTRMD